MKKIIGQKRYNTEASTLIVEWTDDLPEDNPAHCEFNKLYRKMTGEFFLHGKGGATSLYASGRNGFISPGENLIPVTLEEAERICKEHLPDDKVAEVFGKKITDKRKQVNIQIDSGTWNMLQTLKAKTGKSATDIMIDLIRQAADELNES